MPVSEVVSVACNRCGRSESIVLAPGQKKPRYYLCESCKRQLEAQPKELARHLGKSVEAKYGLGSQE